MPIAETRAWANKSATAALGAITLALTIAVIRFFVIAWGAIRLPYGIDYGEGIVWQQMRMIMAGHGYAPLGSFPAIVFHYPPLYHLVTGIAAEVTGGDELATGRVVSLVATLAVTALLVLLTGTLRAQGEQRRPYRLGGIAAAAMVLATKPMVMWGYVMRVDMLFLALSFAGVWLGILALARPKMIYGAALCFVAALFTKQTAIAAPSAVFIILLLVQPRTAIKGIVTGMITAVIALAVLVETTHGGFLKHIILYNINRFAPQRWSLFLGGMGIHAGFLIAALWAIRRRWQRLNLGGKASVILARLRNSPPAAAYAILLVYFMLSTLMLGLIFKSGSAINYFLEWVSLTALFAGTALTEFLLRGEAAKNRQATACEASLFWLLALQIVLLALLVKPDFEDRSRDSAGLARIETLIAQAPQPVIGDDMVGILRAGKPVLWEPSIFSELVTTGTWDERPFLALIRARRFAFFIGDGQPGSHAYQERHSPGVSRALAEAYPQTRYLAQYELRFPAGPLPPGAATLDSSPIQHPRRNLRQMISGLFTG